jgi:hypothetical protein
VKFDTRQERDMDDVGIVRKCFLGGSPAKLVNRDPKVRAGLLVCELFHFFAGQLVTALFKGLR